MIKFIKYLKLKDLNEKRAIELAKRYDEIVNKK